MAATGFAVDPRQLVKPRVFKGDSVNEFTEYRFQLSNYMVMVDARFATLLDQVDSAAQSYETMPSDAAEAAAATTLYVVISATTTGRALRMVMDVRNRDGREALRRLTREFRPNLVGRRMALLRAVMRPEGLRHASGDSNYLDELASWERLVDDYEGMGETLSPSIKAAVLMEYAPQELLQHLRLQAESLGDDYQKIAETVRSYFLSRRVWDVNSGPGPDDPMQVEAVAKGKGYGKDKGHGKGKDKGGKGKCKSGKSKGKGRGGKPDERTERERAATCHQCGRVGHYARNCRSRVSEIAAEDAQSEAASHREERSCDHSAGLSVATLSLGDERRQQPEHTRYVMGIRVLG